MSLDAHVTAFSLQHWQTVKDAVFLTAFRHRTTYRANVPQYVVVVGDNWAFGARVAYVDDDIPAWVPVHDRPYSVAVESRFYEQTSLVQPLDTFLRHLYTVFLDWSSRFALLPIGERRTEEARHIGERRCVNDDWYDVFAHGSKMIRVFPLLPDALHR